MITINGQEVKDFRFPDNTFRITGDDCLFLSRYSKTGRTDGDVYSDSRTLRNEYNMVDIQWNYEKPEELFMLQLVVMHLRDKLGIEDINLHLPYVPNARMDRTKDPMAEVNVLKYFCRIINDMHFNYVEIADPHSDACINQLDNVIQIPMTTWVNKIVNMANADYIFFPDDGAAKRYGPSYNFRPYLNGKKDRDWKTGNIRGLVIENPMNIDPKSIAGKKIIIIDDICSKGGTFWHAGNALKEFGFEHIDLCITHCEHAIFEGKLLTAGSPIEHVYTSTSIINRREDEKITVVDFIRH